MAREIEIKKTTLFVSLMIFSVFAGVLLFGLPKTQIHTENLSEDVKTLELKFALLSNANSNSCGGTFNYVDSMSDDSRIQGSCCSSMNFHRYAEQIEGLKKYSRYNKIPYDPYDIQVSLAKELLDYQKNIILNSEEQFIYDKAMEMSTEGGPCCCKCWHWYAYEGLAKYLITEKGFTSEQIAEVWDLSGACGGSGHAHEDEGGSGH